MDVPFMQLYRNEWDIAHKSDLSRESTLSRRIQPLLPHGAKQLQRNALRDASLAERSLPEVPEASLLVHPLLNHKLIHRKPADTQLLDPPLLHLESAHSQRPHGKRTDGDCSDGQRPHRHPCHGGAHNGRTLQCHRSRIASADHAHDLTPLAHPPFKQKRYHTVTTPRPPHKFTQQFMAQQPAPCTTSSQTGKPR